ncbi:Fumarate reductase (CoM/CoB) subunit B [Candidatus Methanobinarius endosymbioticus]|uniref:Fumarate reductase (CoM/CoB) subunit B n=1 Tax=Candidatus Methanobinarius endosymbioticus TaxID=2006182 RepID=A0A366MBZ2_9EURY|nr:Fumarate reductase (CoM/CoB) subunit B [Candidatus Methanobinarius endosymbioticus]
MIEIKVLRFDREKDKEPYFEKYEIDKTYKMKVLDALLGINEKYNNNLSFRSSCRAGQCGSCAVKINGEVVLSCKAEIEDKDIIEPLDFPVIKDLIVNKSEIEEKVVKMQLFLETKESSKNETNTDNIQIKRCDCPSIIENEDCVDTKKVRSCIECYSCLSACPVIKETDNFAGPYFMRYISKFDFDPRDVGKRTEESIDEGLYYCTSCGKCGEICPKEINGFGDAIEKLRALANNKKLGPLEAHKEVKKTIAKTGRSVEKLEKGFIETITQKRKQNPKRKKKKEKKKIAVFTGCMVDYRLQDVGFALIDVLRKNGVEVDVPEDQVCCGSPMLRTGQTDIAKGLVKKNTEVLSKYDTIITMCAGCGATLKNDYPKYGTELNIMDISEFLADRLDTDQMKDVNMKFTYHDPCHLVRGQGIKYEPRQILNKLKGVEFIEMERPDQCCGAGGGVKAGKPEIAFGLGKKKAKMVEKLDVDTVISICPFCQYNIQDALKEEGMDDIKVMNILELLKMAYDID